MRSGFGTRFDGLEIAHFKDMTSERPQQQVSGSNGLAAAFKKGLLTALALSALAAGCASDIKYGKLPADADPSKEIDTLTSEMSQARKEQVDVYAPISFEKADAALADARLAREKDRSNEDILDDIAKSKAYLQRAKDHAHSSKAVLGEVYSARTKAAAAGAPEFADSKAQYQEADTRLYKFVRDADQGEMPSDADKTRVELLSSFQESELKAIQQKRLGHAREQIRTARNEGAEKLAPKSLATAEAKLAQGVSVIKQDRTNQGAILTASDDANRAADHLLEVTREARASLNKKPEDIAAAKLGDRAAISDMQNQYSELQSTNTGLQAANEGLKSELQNATKLTDTVRMIQAKFAENEAQVFEDGKQVHVRLKGLKFPSGSATIQTSAYPLLGKIRDVLKDADPEMVRIDGRTDNKGSLKKNRELSKKRAESVKEFLAASNSIDPAKVTTEGVDYQRPVVDNKTPDGRAINRGIDVSFVPAGVKAANDAAATASGTEAPAAGDGKQSAGSVGEKTAP
jgi:OOP family OmpA-OmpF porin